MRKLLEELDSEHLHNTLHNTRPESNNTSRDSSRDHTPTNQNALLHSPTNQIPPHTEDPAEISHLLRSPPDYFTDSVLPEDVYLPPEATDSCDDMSLPSVPSYFDIQDTTAEEVSDFDDVMTPRGDVITPFDDVITPRCDVTPRDPLLEDAPQNITDSSFGSCDTVILNTTLHRDLTSKPTQTLALPFRLVKFLPVEQSREREELVEVVEVCGNTIAVQVDMPPHFQGAGCFENVRQELKWLDHETQIQARVIERHVVC